MKQAYNEAVEFLGTFGPATLGYYLDVPFIDDFEWVPVLRALEVARNTEDGPVPPEIAAVLDAAYNDIWSRINRQPNTYILTKEEHAVFNFYQDRYRNDDNRRDLAQRAIRRFWDNQRGSNRPINGS